MYLVQARRGNCSQSSASLNETARYCFLLLGKLLWHDVGEGHLIHTPLLVIPHPVLPDALPGMFVRAVTGDGDKSAKITIESKVEKILAGKSLPPLFGDPYHLPWQFLAFPEEMVCVAVDGSL